jgi:hypothetical protein
MMSDLFSILFGSRKASRAPQSHPRPTLTPAKLPAPVVTPAISLEISKALRQMQFLDKAYGLKLWDTEKHRLDWAHDLELMRAACDLQTVRLQLTDKAGQVCGEYSIAFLLGQRAAPVKADSAGIEMPVIDRNLVADKRVIVTRSGHEDRYKAHLRLNWGPAEDLKHARGDRYNSEHAARITGGREKGEFFVAASSRHNLVITNASAQGTYCFARDVDMKQDGVFVMRQHAPGVPFQVGTRLSALIVQTPKGLQARAARIAA